MTYEDADEADADAAGAKSIGENVTDASDHGICLFFALSMQPSLIMTGRQRKTQSDSGCFVLVKSTTHCTEAESGRAMWQSRQTPSPSWHICSW